MTIQDGFLTYPNINGSLATWQPPDQTLCAFLVAILTTILAYQLAAILFDLLLGLKRPGQATASDISTLILTEDSSPLSILANLNISRKFSEWKFHGFRSKSGTRGDSSTHVCNHDHSPTPIPPRVLAKFLILLAAAPIANLIAVFLTIEKDSNLTFGDVNFGGMAFGINNDFSTARADIRSEVCTPYATRFSRLEYPVAHVFLCAVASITEGLVSASQARLEKLTLSHGRDSNAFRVPRDAILVEYEQFPRLYSTAYHADVQSEGKVYRVRQKVDVALAETIFRNAVNMFIERCKDVRNFTIEEEQAKVLSQNDGNGTWYFEWVHDCPVKSSDIKTILETEFNKFTVIEADKLEVVNIDDVGSAFREGDDIVLLVRRRSFATFGALCITVAVVVVLRIIVRLISNNDVHLGIELVLKDTLRINRCDSMLQNDDRVDYSAQVYEGVDERHSPMMSGSGRSDLTADDRI